MPTEQASSKAPAEEFDEFAGDYDAALNKGLKFTGEKKEYYAEGRVRWLKSRLAALNLPVPTICLDYGCGTGTSAPQLTGALGVSQYFGYDPSSESVAEATKQHGGANAMFLHDMSLVASDSVDMAFCNGVFHHIPPADRPSCLEQIVRVLKPGGTFAFWENNPWNPIVRLLMRLVPFDRDAIMLWPGEAKRLVASAGLTPVDRSYYFIFPSVLAPLRRTEPALSGLPLGGQYLLIFQKR
ncbi:MAG: class I SAM-dependent methyltransferase [Verrucomicrobium sp.]|nr:class I SAM-dependent methyltransferase [Verrucomicrobium sp.]